MVPRIFGPYEPIRRDYPIEEYLADIAGSGVVKSVYVQANWAPERAEDEVAWVQRDGRRDRLAARHRRLCRPAWPTTSRPALDRLARYPLMRGIRMQLHWHENPQYRFAATAGPRRRPDVPPQPRGARRLRLLASTSRSSRRRWQGAARLAADFPQTTFILQHAGMLEDLSEAGQRGMARRACALLAAQPNVVAKLSGLGTFIHRNDPAHIAWIVARDGGALRRRALPLRLELPDREAVDRIMRRCSTPIARRSPAITEAEQRAMLHDTAERNLSAGMIVTRAGRSEPLRYGQH